MSRVMVVEGDSAARDAMRVALVESGHEVLEAEDAEGALAWARAGGVDLVVADVLSPGAPGAALRRELRNHLAGYPAPLIFLRGLGNPFDTELLSDLVDDDLLILVRKPVDLPRLVRLVDSLLGVRDRFEGAFGDGSLNLLLQRVERGREPGVLTAYRGATIHKFAFEAGMAAFHWTNDPREPALRTVDERLRERLLDLFLWHDGKWTWFGGGARLEPRPMTLLEIGSLRVEGVRRADHWRELRAQLPSDEMVLAMSGAPFTAETELDRALMEMAGKGLTIGQIRLERPGEDYAILSRCAELVQSGVLSPWDLPVVSEERQVAEAAREASDPGTTLETHLAAAEFALEAGNLDGARTALLAALDADPVHALARRHLSEVDEKIVRRAEALGLQGFREIRLAVAVESLSESIPPGEAFVLSRLAGGPILIEDLVSICPIPEPEVLQALSRFVERKIVDFT